MKNIKRIFPLETQSFFLFGPRGTGKSTLIKGAFSGAIYVDFLLPDVFRAYSGQPERLKERVMLKVLYILSAEPFVLSDKESRWT